MPPPKRPKAGIAWMKDLLPDICSESEHNVSQLADSAMEFSNKVAVMMDTHSNHNVLKNALGRNDEPQVCRAHPIMAQNEELFINKEKLKSIKPAEIDSYQMTLKLENGEKIERPVLMNMLLAEDTDQTPSDYQPEIPKFGFQSIHICAPGKSNKNILLEKMMMPECDSEVICIRPDPELLDANIPVNNSKMNVNHFQNETRCSLQEQDISLQATSDHLDMDKVPALIRLPSGAKVEHHASFMEQSSTQFVNTYHGVLSRLASAFMQDDIPHSPAHRNLEQPLNLALDKFHFQNDQPHVLLNDHGPISPTSSMNRSWNGQTIPSVARGQTQSHPYHRNSLPQNLKSSSPLNIPVDERNFNIKNTHRSIFNEFQANELIKQDKLMSINQCIDNIVRSALFAQDSANSNFNNKSPAMSPVTQQLISSSPHMNNTRASLATGQKRQNHMVLHSGGEVGSCYKNGMPSSYNNGIPIKSDLIKNDIEESRAEIMSEMSNGENSTSTISEFDADNRYGDSYLHHRESRLSMDNRAGFSEQNRQPSTEHQFHYNDTENSSDAIIITRDSPSTSTESLNQKDTDSNEDDHKNITGRLCQVCRDGASGFHYGVWSCEGCKAFFKRSLQGPVNYVCPATNNCTIDKHRRKSCQSCRLRKCMQTGMARGNCREKKSYNSRQMKRKSQDVGGTPPKYQAVSGHYPDQQQLRKEPLVCSVRPLVDPDPRPAPPPPEPSQNEALSVHPLVAHLHKIEPKPQTADLGNNWQCATPEELLEILLNLADKELVATVIWARAIPGYMELTLVDRMFLMESAWMDILLLGLVWRSQSHTDQIVFARNWTVTKNDLAHVDCLKISHKVLKMIECFKQQELTEDEMVLLRACVLLNAGMQNLGTQKSFIDLQDKIHNALHYTVVKTGKQSAGRLLKLMGLLPHLRQLGLEITLLLTQLKRDNKLPPFNQSLIGEILSS